MRRLSEIGAANRMSQNATFRRIFLVILISIFIPVSIMTVVLGNFSNRYLMQQVDIARSEAIVQKVRFFEQKIDEVDALVNQLLAVESVIDLITGNTNTTVSLMNMRSTTDLFEKSIINNSDIQSIYMYSDRDDYVLSYARFDKDDFYDPEGINHNFDGKAYVTGLRVVEGDRIFSYVRGFQSFDRSVKTYLVINLDYDRFWNSIIAPGAEAGLAHKVVAYGDQVLYEASYKDVFGEVPDEAVRRWESELHDFEGIFIAEQLTSELNRPMYLLIRSYVLTVAVIVVIAFLLAYFFSTRLYQPLQRLAEKIREITKVDMEYETEYQLIDEVIAYLISENIKVSEDYEYLVPYFERHSISDLVEGKIISDSGYQKVLDLLNVKFSFDSFCLLLCEFHSSHKAEELTELLKLFFSSDSVNAVISRVSEGRFLIILNTELRMQEIYDYTKEVHSKLQNEGHALTVSLGDRFDDFSEMNNAYQKVYEQLEYKFFAGKNSVLHHLMTEQIHENDLYNRELESQLLDAVKKQDSSLAYDIIGQIGDYHRQQSHNIDYTRYNYFILCLSITEQMNRFGFSVKDLEVSDSHMFEIINSAVTLEAMDDYVYTLIDRCIELFSKLNAMQEDSIIIKVKSYMDDNYHQDLSLDMIASSVYLSPGYLSSIFKQETGITVFDYLTNLRMDKAKELLISEKQMKVQEVARKVGYNNSQSFIRHFKKYFNTTPGGFRK